MSDKVLFVTGATRNTGLAVAQKFASEGWQVALTSRDGARAAKTAAELERSYGVKTRGYGMGLKEVQEIRRTFAAVREEFGRLDAFVAVSASLGVDIDLLRATEEEYDEVMGTNVKGNYFCCQEAARIMKDTGGGSIVLIGSCHYKATIWGRSLYAASKGALASLTRSMAVELGAYGIRCNIIVAGAIHTERWEASTEEQKQKRRANYPVGRESTGEDIANGVFYLGTDLSGTVTGTDLTIDSGIGVCLLPYNGGAH